MEPFIQPDFSIPVPWTPASGVLVHEFGGGEEGTNGLTLSSSRLFFYHAGHPLLELTAQFSTDGAIIIHFIHPNFCFDPSRMIVTYSSISLPPPPTPTLTFRHKYPITECRFNKTTTYDRTNNTVTAVCLFQSVNTVFIVFYPPPPILHPETETLSSLWLFLLGNCAPKSLLLYWDGDFEGWEG